MLELWSFGTFWTGAKAPKIKSSKVLDRTLSFELSNFGTLELRALSDWAQTPKDRKFASSKSNFEFRAFELWDFGASGPFGLGPKLQKIESSKVLGPTLSFGLSNFGTLELWALLDRAQSPKGTNAPRIESSKVQG